MSYNRVIPRDLFNEANLLKCYGALEISLEPYGYALEHDGEGFLIIQDETSGALSVENLWLTVRGCDYRFTRPLNSREAWPLFCSGIAVFNCNGFLTDEFIKFLTDENYDFI